MSYREAFLLGWSIAWRQCVWALAIVVPLGLIAVVIINQVTPNTGVRQQAFALAFYPLVAALMVLVIFPKSIRAALSKPYRSFRVQVSKHGSPAALSYSDAMQVSFLTVIVSMILGGLYSLIEFPSVQLGALVEIPLLLFVIYPAVAEAAVYVPYRGFRLVVER